MKRENSWQRRELLKSVIGTGGVLLMNRGIGTGHAAAQSGRLELSNEHLRVSVSETTGQFRLWTADDQALTFPEDDTSFLTVRVDEESFVTGGETAGTDMQQYMTSPPSEDAEGQSRTEWDLPDVAVTRELVLEGEAARFSVTVRNNSQEPHDIEVRYLLDYQVDNQDGAPIFADGNVFTNEQRFESPSFDTHLTYDRIPDPELVGVATNDGRVDIIDFVYWENAHQQAYRYTPDSSVEFYEPGESSFPNSDSAGVNYWELGTLAPDEEATVSTYYGVGAPESGRIDGFERRLDEFRDAVTGLLSTTVAGRARAHAELYTEVGETYARNLTNYFGYEAGIEGIDSGDIDSEFREPLDTLTEGVDQPNAERLYRFFEEMFATVSPDDNIEDTVSTFEQYFRGVAEEQDHRLLVNGQTIDELEERFVDDFNGRVEDSLEALREEDLSEGVLDDLIAFVEQKTDSVRTREREFEDNLNETIESVKNGDEVRAVGSSLETAGYSVLAAGVIAVPATGGASKLVSLPVGGSLVLLATAITGLASLNAAYTGSAATASLGWMQYSSMYWTTMTTWANSGPSAKGVLRSLVTDALLEELGLSLEQIIEEYTGVEIELITGLTDLAATQVEYALEGTVEFTENIGREVVITDLAVSEISSNDIEDGWATETATLTLENRSTDTVTPTLDVGQTEVRSVGFGRLRPFPSVGSYVLLREPIPEIQPGDTAEVQLEYGLPVKGGGPRFLGLYELVVSVAATPHQFNEDVTTSTFHFVDLPEFPEVETRRLLDSRLQTRESATETITPTDGTDRISVEMAYSGSDFDLHLYDPAGNHVGRNYENGEFETEIPGITTAGPDGAGGTGEHIVVDDPSSESYETEVIALEADSTGTSYVTTVTQMVGLEPLLDTVPGAITVHAREGRVERLLAVEEVTGVGTLTEVTVTPSNLQPEDGDSDPIPAANVQVNSTPFDVEAGGMEMMSLALELPDTVGSAQYSGALEVQSAELETTIPLRVVGSASRGSVDGIESELLVGAGATGLVALYILSRMLKENESDEQVWDDYRRRK